MRSVEAESSSLRSRRAGLQYVVQDNVHVAAGSVPVMHLCQAAQQCTVALN